MASKLGLVSLALRLVMRRQVLKPLLVIHLLVCAEEFDLAMH